MKEMEQPKYIQDLIIANATGNISEEEKKELNVWKSQSESNMNEYIRLTRLCRRTGLAVGWDDVDIENARELFKTRRIKTKRLIPLWTRVAAAVIIIFSIGGLYYFQNTSVADQIKITDIAPGHPKAMLTLSDGRIVNLGEAKHKIVKEMNGVEINDNAVGTIVYDRNPELKLSEIKYNTIRVPKGGEYQLVLSDGTKVWLNSETTLKYPVTFVGNTREVTLIGEAYFKVAHNKEKPFYVSSEVTKVKVLGTSFNFKAYRGEENTEITLAEGKVDVEVGNNNYILIPGKQVKINRSNREAEVINVVVDRYVSWKDGVFQFVDITMEELVESLSRWYNVKFEFSKESLKYERFSGAVTKYRNINYILKLIEETNDLRFEINKDIITVKER